MGAPMRLQQLTRRQPAALLRGRRCSWRSLSTTAAKIPLTSDDGAKDWARPPLSAHAARFEGQNCVVTGSRMGLGFTIARSLAAEGANVCLVDLKDASEAAATIEQESGAGGSIHHLQCDITDEAAVVAMGARVGELFGGEVHVLVNNAGYNGKCQLVRDMALADWELTLRINLTGTMLVTRELIPHLEAARGNVCNLVSRHDIAAIWVAFFSRWQRYLC